MAVPFRKVALNENRWFACLIVDWSLKNSINWHDSIFLRIFRIRLIGMIQYCKNKYDWKYNFKFLEILTNFYEFFTNSGGPFVLEYLLWRFVGNLDLGIFSTPNNRMLLVALRRLRMRRKCKQANYQMWLRWTKFCYLRMW